MKKERMCKNCPAFYECTDDNVSATAGGYTHLNIDGKQVLCCRPARVFGAKRVMQRFSFYCLATSLAKKIGSKASWTGRTPIWCPLGRERKD